ncbi:hypothetical protein ACFOZ1_14905 [Gracilibacillus marinus]|uniref:Uncharacterized protein n=1 Tax=Gracilibacillus marinus TaxID=630535 RepID=A0ABV8VYU4_9BACI
MQVLDEIKVIKDEQTKTNQRLDAIQEQTTKISEFHAEITEKSSNKATKNDFEYLKQMIFRHDEEIHKIKSQLLRVNKN